ncbi:uncharacterized protein B0H18DRAFT_1022459 [Fomitopsis serialis]|uniref:uncharacterized protein n=1 Tax=Fomitopsis serialis TaxID=139415 RepID=UPI00200832B9|nr:uncharacterized protein B0H18DRAFT_1022459 [Neoantrodia serialis]KAH9921043.1 hypothetical protein B0H18DRAFT_1022459 [Neoantrodia serialis]
MPLLHHRLGERRRDSSRATVVHHILRRAALEPRPTLCRRRYAPAPVLLPCSAYDHRLTALKVISRFCQIDLYFKDIWEAFTSRKTLCFNVSARGALDKFLWCLKPAQVSACSHLLFKLQTRTPSPVLLVRPQIATKPRFATRCTSAQTISPPMSCSNITASNGLPSPTMTVPRTRVCSPRTKHLHQGTDIDLSIPDLLRVHAALAGVVNQCGSISVFNLFLRLLPKVTATPSLFGSTSG